MTDANPGNPVWVLEPGPDGEVHYAINYVGGPVQAACNKTVAPTYLYREHDRPDGAKVCLPCKTAFEVIIATRFRRADALLINDVVIMGDVKRRVVNVAGDAHDPNIVTVTHVAMDDSTDTQERRCAPNHVFERVGMFSGFIPTT